MPLKIIKSKSPKIVLFYQASCPFSNFHPAHFSIKINGNLVHFSCSEQYFMYQKALLAKDPEGAEEILKMTKPLLMKRAGRSLEMTPEMLEEWSSISENVMYDGCLLKFSQNDDLKLALLRTRGMLLAEASARDRLWGIGLGVTDKRAEDMKQWKGANKLGKVLEKVREEIWQK
ncbi:hypothetical protein L5515_009459 [Caenorhabditis briggsae]|uniref:NADAR domain-containing protein n=1 Tax=Caenorhabditis briggsae TaxID=6238 RepID=A0AAE9JMA1_CAEBR|nr:hypothetical protein L5515_009459 [Caenorhabditis briggsae]